MPSPVLATKCRPGSIGRPMPPTGFDGSITETGRAVGGAGAAAAEVAEPAKTGREAAVATLADYAAKARDIGGYIGQTLVGEFVKTGKQNCGDLVTSMIADLIDDEAPKRDKVSVVLSQFRFDQVPMLSCFSFESHEAFSAQG